MMWQNAGKSGIDQWAFTMDPLSRAQVGEGGHRIGFNIWTENNIRSHPKPCTFGAPNTRV
jgi:hypothetical protein